LRRPFASEMRLETNLIDGFFGAQPRGPRHSRRRSTRLAGASGLSETPSRGNMRLKSTAICWGLPVKLKARFGIAICALSDRRVAAICQQASWPETKK
jgi:hypothetical protein